MFYENMSDDEINREVASYFYCPNWLSRHAEQLGMVPDYCNDPSDTWPIIVENEISIWAVSETDYEIGMSYTTGEWKAYCVKSIDGESCVGDDGFEASDQNPLRAAMICFLKMKDGN